MELSCLFVNYNSWGLLADALDSLRRHPPATAAGAPIPYEIVVVDNASTAVDGAARDRVQGEVRRVGGELVQHRANGGYAAGMNLALAHSRGRRLLVSNPDVVFTPGAVTALIAQLDADPGIGVVEPAVHGDRACRVHMPAHVLPTIADLARTTLGTISAAWNRRYSARRTRAALRTWGAAGPLDGAMFGGCCFLTSRAVVERVGFFDERYPLYFEDTDLALRVRRSGLRIVRVAAARVVHLYDRSAATDRAEAMRRHALSRRRFFARWYGPAGRFAVAASSWLLGTRWARARAQAVAGRHGREVAWIDGGPVIALPRDCRRLLIEIAFEPWFFLAAGTFAAGDRWSPGDSVVEQLRRESWIRAVDLDGPEPVELGVWHCPAVAAAAPATPGPAHVADGRPTALENSVPPFNRIAGGFADDLARPEYRAIVAAIDDVRDRHARMGRPLRRDLARDWEYAHVLVEFERLVRASAGSRPIERVLDVGGGNSPVAYLLAERGFRVVVVDPDPVVIDAVRCNSRELQWGDRLIALRPEHGRVPMFDAAFDCALSISVVEGVLRRDRPRFFGEIARTLRPGRSLLLTFDYGDEARFVGDPPTTVAEVERDLVRVSGLELVGELPAPPQFGPDGPPVRNAVVAADGRATQIAYTFGALHLRRA